MIGVLILIVFVGAALLLIGLVLLQDEQGEGLGGIFGGGSATPFGTQSANILTKATRIVGVVFLVSAFVLGFVYKTPASGSLQEAASLEGQDSAPSNWWDAEVENADTDDTAE